MLILPFKIHPLEDFQKYITNYKGLDLSFFGANVSHYINEWVAPTYQTKLNDREIVVTYTLQNLEQVNRLIEKLSVRYNDLLIYSGIDLVSVTYSMKAFLNNVSYDAFADYFTVTANFIAEAGFRKTTTYNNQNNVSVGRDESAGPIGWRLTLKSLVDTNKKIYIGWSWLEYVGEGTFTRHYVPVFAIPGNVKDKVIVIDANDISKSFVDYITLAQAIEKGIVTVESSDILMPSTQDYNSAVTFYCSNVAADAVTWEITTRKMIL